jgi:hypothetical protein
MSPVNTLEPEIDMKPKKRGKAPSPALQTRLAELEDLAAKKGIQIHYDLLEAAGLKLKGGICAIKGEYHLFVEKRKSTAEIIDFLQDHLTHPFPKDVPQINEYMDEN